MESGTFDPYGLPDDIHQLVGPLIGIYGLDVLNKPEHKLVWETFTENRKVERLPLTFKLLNEGHVFPGAKQKRHSYEWYTPKGILKSNWISKYLTVVPSLVVVFWDLDWGDPKWNEKRNNISQAIQLLKTSLVGRSTRLAVVLLQSSPSTVSGQESGAAEKAASLCANCDLPPANLFVLPRSDSHLLGYATRLETALNEIAGGFYMSEIKCIKSHRDFLNKTNHHILFIRHQFKLGFHNEMRSDQSTALKHYAQCYQLLHDHRITNTNLHEVRIVAAMVNFKLCQLNFALNFPRDAIEQFKTHIDLFRQRTGPRELIFEHYAWLSTQYKIFAEVFLNAVKNGLPSVQTQHPGFYYQQSAKHAVMRRNLALQMCKDIAEPHEEMLEGWDSLEYYGQRPWRSGKHVLEPPEMESEANGVKAICFHELHNVKHSEIILPLFLMAITQFNIHRCPRIKKHLMVQMAEEYLINKNPKEALELLNHVMWDYRTEYWTTLLSSCSFLALKCSLLTGSVSDYLSHCLEILGRHVKAAPEEKERVLQNFQRVIDGDEPLGEPSMDPQQMSSAMALWNETDPNSIKVNMSVLLPCLEVRASFDKESFHIDEVIGLTVIIRNDLNIPLQFLRVTVLTSATVGEATEYNKENLLIEPHGTLRVHTNLQPDMADLGQTVKLLGVNIGLGSWSHPITLQWTGCGNQGTIGHRLAGGHKEFRLTMESFNDPLITETQIANREPLMQMDVEFDPMVLVWEWLPIKIHLQNQESTKTSNVKLSLSLDDLAKVSSKDSESKALLETTKISTQANLESKLVLSSATELDAGPFEIGEEKYQWLYVKTLTAAKRPLKLEIEYTSTIEVKGKKINCPAARVHRFILQSKLPFQINISTQSLKFEPISRLSRNEKFVVVPRVKCLSHVPITFVKSSVVVENGVQLCGEALSQVIDVALESGEEATDCFPLGFTSDLSKTSDIQLGQYMLYWKRSDSNSPVVSVSVSLPVVSVEDCGLWVEMMVPAHGQVKVPMTVTYKIKNTSDCLKEIVVSMQVSDAFMFSGHKETRFRILPDWEESITYTLYPLISGHVPFPKIVIAFDTKSSVGSISEFLARILPSSIFIMPQAKNNTSQILSSQSVIAAS